MKICFVLEHYYPHIGGAETRFKYLAEGLVEKNHQCLVVTSMLPGTGKREKLNGVDVYRVKVPRLFGRYWFTVLSIPAVYAAARGSDILQTTTYNGAFPAFVASRLLKKPVTITVHEVLGDGWMTMPGLSRMSSRLHALAEKNIIRLPFDKYICVSHYTRSRTRSCGIDDEKTEVIYPGIERSVFSNDERSGYLIREKEGLKGKFVYLYFGRPGYFKGVEYLLRAVPLISKRIPHAKLVLILSKEPAARYRKALSIIKDLKIESSLLLLDSMPVEELTKYISCCDCVVVPSLTEGFGFSCVEACVMGKTVVATDAGAIPEVISGRYVTVNPCSSEEICRGIENAYLGRVVSRPVKYYNWNDCVSRHEELYSELLKR